MHAIAGFVLAAALGAFGSGATAAAEPLPEGSWASPPNGASRPASSWPNATTFEMFEFTIYSDFPAGADEHYDVEVAGGPELDPDGTLADAARVDAYAVPRRPGTDDIFSARTNVASRWLATPGTYYWQAYYREPDEPDEPPYTTPVQRITITPQPPPEPPDPPRHPRPPPPPATLPPPPPPPPAVKPAARLTLGAARGAVRLTIRRKTGRRPRGLRSVCDRETDFIVTCRTRWRDARYTYRGTMTVRSQPTGIHAALRGSRTRRACSRRCRHPIRW
jgi:hypothetical protein